MAGGGGGEIYTPIFGGHLFLTYFTGPEGAWPNGSAGVNVSTINVIPITLFPV